MILFFFQHPLDAVKYFAPPGATVQEATTLIIVLAALVLSGIGTWAIVHYGRLWVARRHHRQRFRAIAVKQGLGHRDRQFLRRIAQVYNLVQLDLLVTDPRTFDRYMFRVAERAERLRPAKRDRRLQRIATIRAKLEYDRLDGSPMLRSTRDLAEGHTVDLSVPYKDTVIKLPAHIHANTEQDWVLELEDVSPIKGQIPVNAPLTVTFNMPDDASYEIPAVVKRVDAFPIMRLHLEHTLQMKRVQHRKFPRIALDLPIVYALLTEAQEKQLRRPRETLKFAQSVLAKGKFIDIGAGGLAMETDQELEEGVLVHFTFDLLTEVREITGVVGRVIQTEPAGEGRYRIFCKFVKIPEIIRRQVQRFIYENLRVATKKKKSEEEPSPETGTAESSGKEDATQ